MMPDAHDLSQYWRVPREWPGEACFILAGGPSLRGFDPSVLRNFRVFAVNNSYQIAPWADVLYFGDRRWYEWNKEELGKFRGKYLVTRGLLGAKRKGLDIKILRYNKTNWSRDRDCVGGRDSGHGAINLAYHFGCDPIFLLGFDMRLVDGKNNWHNAHRVQQKPEKYTNDFLPNLREAAAEIAKSGSPRIFNCTPGSALREWPFITLTWAITFARAQFTVKRGFENLMEKTA